MFMVPSSVNNSPCLAFLEGITQSNMSTPRAMHSSRLLGVPTPIKYLGFDLGNISVTKAVISYKSSSGSPTDNPPIALPMAFFEAIYSADSFRKSLNVLP